MKIKNENGTFDLGKDSDIKKFNTFLDKEKKRRYLIVRTSQVGEFILKKSRRLTIYIISVLGSIGIGILVTKIFGF